MYSKDIFLKSVLVCALEAIFFINIIKNMSITESFKLLELKPFDYWRLLESFVKFDPMMPKNLLNHFKEIEQKIVTETAWHIGSPVVEIIQQIVR